MSQKYTLYLKKHEKRKWDENLKKLMKVIKGSKGKFKKKRSIECGRKWVAAGWVKEGAREWKTSDFGGQETDQWTKQVVLFPRIKSLHEKDIKTPKFINPRR